MRIAASSVPASSTARSIPERSAPRAAGPVPAGYRALVLQRTCACGGQDEDCECGSHGQSPKQRRNPVQRAPEGSGASPGGVPASVHQVVGGPGRSLPPAVRASLEPRLGHDFGHVQLHTGPDAAASAREVGARAYTVGAHIVLAGNAPAPDSTAGRSLLAHELTHVVQQSRGGLSPGIDPDASAEREAERAGRALVTP